MPWRKNHTRVPAGWSERRIGDFLFWIEAREHLRITFKPATPYEKQILRFCSFQIRNDQLTLRRFEIASDCRGVGWGREAILELRRRFPNHRIIVDGIEVDPNATAFWRKMQEDGLVVASDLASIEEMVERHRQAPYSVARDNWAERQERTDEARRLMDLYRDQTASLN